jgi:hypothetical protein
MWEAPNLCAGYVTIQAPSGGSNFYSTAPFRDSPFNKIYIRSCPQFFCLNAAVNEFHCNIHFERTLPLCPHFDINFLFRIDKFDSFSTNTPSFSWLVFFWEEQQEAWCLLLTTNIFLAMLALFKNKVKS